MNTATMSNFLGIEITEKWKTFTSFLMIPILFATMFVSACSFTNVLADGEKIISYIPVAVAIALPLVCLDAAVCAEAQAAAKLLDASQVIVLNLFQEWQAASTAAQPGILAQLQAAIATLDKNYVSLLSTFRVSNSVIAAEVGAILSAILAAIQQIASLTGSVIRAGGTMADFKKLKVSKIYSPKNFKSDVLSAVSKKTGNADVDRINASSQTSVKAW